PEERARHAGRPGLVRVGHGRVAVLDRSEEHTSELQSLTNLVCRLLLEKKKDTQRTSAAQAPRPVYCRRTKQRAESRIRVGTAGWPRTARARPRPSQPRPPAPAHPLHCL